MFVDIENFKSVIAVENILTPYQKGRVTPDKKSRLPKEPITPQVCMQILKSTNNPVNIKHMLECIKELPQTKQAQFKEIILATFTQREQPQVIFDLGEDLALANGFGVEFNKICQKKGQTLLLSSSRAERVYVANDCRLEQIDLKGYDKLFYEGKDNLKFQFMDYLPPIIEARHCSSVDFEQVSIKGVKKIVTNENCEVYFTNLRDYERDMDLSTASCVYVDVNDVDLLETWKCAHERLVFFKKDEYFMDKLLDLSYFDSVYFSGCDFEPDTKLVFKDGGKLEALYISAFPENVDFSKCSELVTVGCYFHNQPHMRFRNGAKISLVFAQNFPANLDFSECAEVDLSNCDLKDYDALKLAPNVILNLSGAINLPQNMDFSQCAEVRFYQCDWARQPHPCFKNAKKIIAKSMGYTNILTEESGVENCDELMLDTCDFSNFKSLKPKKGAKVNFRFGKNFPTDMDLSQCAEVVLKNANLNGVNGLNLANAHKVNLQDVKEFSGAIDVSNADEVDMSWADWANLGDIKFKDGAKVNFEYSQNLPSDIDWSKFSEVKMQFCILNARRDMVFRNGAKVDLSIATLPECVMDFSLCAEVNLSETTVPKKAHFIFKNRAQTEESKLVLPKKWKGRISFKDELDDVSKSQKNTSLGGLFGKFFTKDGR